MPAAPLRKSTLMRPACIRSLPYGRIAFAWPSAPTPSARQVVAAGKNLPLAIASPNPQEVNLPFLPFSLAASPLSCLSSCRQPAPVAEPVEHACSVPQRLLGAISCCFFLPKRSSSSQIHPRLFSRRLPAARFSRPHGTKPCLPAPLGSSPCVCVCVTMPPSRPRHSRHVVGGSLPRSIHLA